MASICCSPPLRVMPAWLILSLRRGIKAFGLTYAIASRGGDHLRAEPFFELTERYDEAKKQWGIREIAE